MTDRQIAMKELDSADPLQQIFAALFLYLDTVAVVGWQVRIPAGTNEPLGD